MAFHVTFNNSTVIPWWSGLLVEETGVPGENYRHISRNCSNFLEDNDICFYLSIDINSTYDYTVAINGRFNRCFN